MIFSLFEILFYFSIVGLTLFFPVYPLAVFLLAATRKAPEPAPMKDKSKEETPFVSLVTVVRDGGELMDAKIADFEKLDYPEERLEFIIFEDGLSRELEEKIRSHNNDRIFLYGLEDHRGKIAALNQAVGKCRGEILVFSDADALLEPSTIHRLTAWFETRSIGGVCGRRVISEGSDSSLGRPQRSYLDLDHSIKLAESRLGSITSNDGKLYAIRKKLYSEIPSAVTDDLYLGLSVVRQGYRLAYDPRAKAHIRLPSRTEKHELERRRRIVSTSLRCIYLNRELLNPGRYGFYSFQLFINKVVRRLIPLFLLGLFASSFFLAGRSVLAAVLAACQAFFYLTALWYKLLDSGSDSNTTVRKAAALAFYFTLGNLGAFLGVIDFLTGKKIDKWTPKKGAS